MGCLIFLSSLILFLINFLTSHMNAPFFKGCCSILLSYEAKFTSSSQIPFNRLLSYSFYPYITCRASNTMLRINNQDFRHRVKERRYILCEMYHFLLYHHWDLNPDEHYCPTDFKSVLSTYSNMVAYVSTILSFPFYSLVGGLVFFIFTSFNFVLQRYEKFFIYTIVFYLFI